MLWDKLKYKKSLITMKFAKGINSANDPLDLDNDELTDSLNMCADDYPIIRTRNDRLLSSLPQLGTLYGMGQRNSQELHVLSSNTWAYGAASDSAWTNISTSILSPNVPSFVEFNTQTAKYTIMAYSSGVVYNSYWDGSLYSTFSDTNCPRSNLFTAHRNRLYGVDKDNRTLKYCALGDLTDWTTVDNAGYVDITNAKGAITAITTYADHVILWTANSMHELYGTYVDNYELVNVSKNIGCVSRFGFVEAEGRLFWIDTEGIYMYTGGLPRKIADKADGILKEIPSSKLDEIKAGGIGSKLYFCLPQGSTYKVLVIDIIEDDKRKTYTVNKENGTFNSFTRNDNKLYGLRNDGYIYNMHSTHSTGVDNSTAISWFMETRPITDDEIDKESAIKDIWIQHSGTSNATMTFSFTSNDNSTSFTQMAASSDFRHLQWSVRKRVIPTSTQLQGLSFMKFRYAGTGQKKISGTKFNIISYGEG
jgi:hypothetical protein